MMSWRRLAFTLTVSPLPIPLDPLHRQVYETHTIIDACKHNDVDKVS